MLMTRIKIVFKSPEAGKGGLDPLVVHMHEPRSGRGPTCSLGHLTPVPRVATSPPPFLFPYCGSVLHGTEVFILWVPLRAILELKRI